MGPEVGPIAPKSRAGRRRVPMSMLVRRELREQQLRSGRRGEELVFGRTPELAFMQQTLHRRTKKAWGRRADRRVGGGRAARRPGCTTPAITA